MLYIDIKHTKYAMRITTDLIKSIYLGNPPTLVIVTYPNTTNNLCNFDMPKSTGAVNTDKNWLTSRKAITSVRRQVKINQV